ncbi:MAG: hypothetical protein WKF76_04270 [Nocardioidaceae bacterium]
MEAVLGGFTAAGLTMSQLAVHFHDTYGQALSNALTAMRLGVTTFDSSAGGSAAARTPKAPPATSPPKTLSGSCTDLASTPASTWRHWSRRAAGWVRRSASRRSRGWRPPSPDDAGRPSREAARSSGPGRSPGCLEDCWPCSRQQTSYRRCKTCSTRHTPRPRSTFATSSTTTARCGRLRSPP